MPTPVSSLRLDTKLLTRLDAYAARLSMETGLPVSRNAAVVKLLTEGLDRVGQPAEPVDSVRALALQHVPRAIEVLREVAVQTRDPRAAKQAAEALRKRGLKVPTEADRKPRSTPRAPRR